MSGRKVKDRTRCTIDREKLAEGIRRCMIFRLFDPSENNVRYYFGGGFYDKQRNHITIWSDILRPLNNIVIAAKDIIHIQFDGTTLDILCQDGTWISSMVLPKIRSDSCSFRYLRFDDERIVSYREGIAIVDLPLLDVPVADINRTTVNYPPEPAVMHHPNPLTIGYVKKDNVIYIGYWDIIENKFIGKLQEYWMELLDIKL